MASNGLYKEIKALTLEYKALGLKNSLLQNPENKVFWPKIAPYIPFKRNIGPYIPYIPFKGNIGLLIKRALRAT